MEWSALCLDLGKKTRNNGQPAMLYAYERTPTVLHNLTVFAACNTLCTIRHALYSEFYNSVNDVSWHMGISNNYMSFL
jgi:hypothetical protein